MIRFRRILVAVGTSTALVLAAAPAAHAVGPFEQNPTRSGDAGVVSASENIELVGGNGTWMADAKRFTYHSTDSMGRASVDRATYIEPRMPWTGDGPRPLVAIAPGTQGAGEKCDPSNTVTQGIAVDFTPLDLGISYELLPAAEHLSRGAAIVLIDHHRNPDTGSQEYVDNISSGQSLLDAAVAARDFGVDPATPVGLYGYSQGGGASGWAAENAHVYAPELNIVASAVGAPPSTLVEVLDSIDGSILTAAAAYAINGVLSKDPELREEVYETELNDAGRRWLDSSDQLCVVGSVIDSGYRSTSKYTADGSTLGEIIADRYPHVLVELERQQLGKKAPGHDVFLWGGVNDDIIPIEQIRAVNAAWSGQGAEVTYVEDPTVRIPGRAAINHIVPMLSQFVAAADFLWARMAPGYASTIPGLPGSLTPQPPQLPGLPGLPGSDAGSVAPGTPAAPEVPGAASIAGLPEQAAIPSFDSLPSVGVGGA
ncbi:lipase family protein [uncultured Corynebacterium sp.]|uniref:lipase family protein n=1 Tax=uncultured Corynebacterium sp. TaxID=159447 RepID=UPI0025DEE9D8|nr:lipase family protein [uncultured Corynebacterium sp.]